MQSKIFTASDIKSLENALNEFLREDINLINVSSTEVSGYLAVIVFFKKQSENQNLGKLEN